MKRSDFYILRILGIIVLIAEVVQFAVGIAAYTTMSELNVLHHQPAALSFFLIPTILLCLYIVMRLYTEMHCVWRTILAALGYPILILLYLIVFVLGLGSKFTYVLLPLTVAIFALLPLILFLVGLLRKKTQASLAALMLYSGFYVVYFISSGNIQIALAALLTPALLLLIAVDLFICHRSSTKPVSV